MFSVFKKQVNAIIFEYRSLLARSLNLELFLQTSRRVTQNIEKKPLKASTLKKKQEDESTRFSMVSSRLESSVISNAGLNLENLIFRTCGTYNIKYPNEVYQKIQIYFNNLFKISIKKIRQYMEMH
ncbi:hypothetical protein BpHYR1_002048 [Brachionus plicatilis]|uniref:Uncharacterized protein n=1 Tax=Brachionus plicatilis TaxID=10195 RepID=A0A3M7R1T7_BRAPC|nr:hypothetical protein BpHYR1_002048 [Brachionus plicatilis]